MRRVLHLLFAFLYATLSSGAPSLVHYCAHDNDIHLSSPKHEHEQMSCCEHEQQEQETSCHSVPETSTSNQIEESDDCCATSFVTLDYAKQESTHFSSAKIESQIEIQWAVAMEEFIVTRKVESNTSKRGPPLYVLYQRLVLYA